MIVNGKVSFEEWESRVENESDLELLDTYYKVRKDTNRNETWLSIRCKKCGKVFERNGNQYRKSKSVKSCVECDNLLSVSRLHAIVSCIAKELYPDSEFEYDIGFKGRRGGSSKYDLYIPQTNTIVEFQSRFHDNNIGFDLKKRDYAIKLGYDYKSFDHRHDKVDEVCYALFGDKYEIFNLELIDVSVFNKIQFDLSYAQELLYKYHTYKQIAQKLGIHYCNIKRYVDNGTLKLPENFRNTSQNIKPFVQLSMDGDFINRYSSSTEMQKSEEFNGKKVTVKSKSVVCQYGFAWVTEEDYLNGDFKIPDVTANHCKTFAMVTEDMEIMKTYTSIAEACNDIKLVHSTYLKHVLEGKRETVLGHRFKFLYKLKLKK